MAKMSFKLDDLLQVPKLAMYAVEEKKVPLSGKFWQCLCSARHDRDINAAKERAKKAISDALGASACVKRYSATIPIRVGVAATGVDFLG